MPETFLHEAQRFVRARFARGQRYGLAFTIALLIIGTGMWLFLGIITEVAEQETLYHLDGEVRDLFERVLSPDFARVVVGFTNTGGFIGTLVLVAVVALALLWRRRWWPALELVATSALGALLVQGFKLLFARSRPEDGFISEAGYSYPSGHAFMAVVFYGYLVLLVWRWVESPFWRALAAVGALVMIVLLGVSRLYLGVHWMTDVLGGYAFGMAWLTASLLIFARVERRVRQAALRRHGEGAA